MWSSRRPGAMTLAEVVVYCGLLSLFSVMLFVALPGRDNTSVEDLYQATSRANVALSRLSMDLGNAAATSVVATKDPVGLVFLVATNDQSQNFTYLSDGELAWKGWVGYFLRGRELVRVWHPLKAPASKSAVGSPPLLSEMLNRGTSQAVWPGVDGFSVALGDNNLWLFRLELRVGSSSTTLTTGVGARN